MSISANWDEINLVSLVDFHNGYCDGRIPNSKMQLLAILGDLLNGVIKEELFEELYGDGINEKKYIQNKKKSQASLKVGFKKICHNDGEPTKLTRGIFSREVDRIQKEYIKDCKLSLQSQNKPLSDRLITNREALQKNVEELYTIYFDRCFVYEDICDYFGKLRAKCMEPHFSKGELDKINDWIGNGCFALVWYEMWLHAFQCSYYNMPYMYANRAYYEALTLKRNNYMYKELLRTARSSVKENKYSGVEIKVNCKEATLEYGMQIFETEFDEGVRCFNDILPGKDQKKPSLSSMAACWILAFQFENSWRKIEVEMLESIENNENYKKILNLNYNNRDYDEKKKKRGLIWSLVSIVTNEKEQRCMKVALDIYVYLCTTLEFSKAFNSIGKLLLLGKIRLKDEIAIEGTIDDCPLSRKYALDCLNKAIVLGNGNAMVNWARYYMERLPANDRNIRSEIQEEAQGNYKEIVRRLKIMADLKEAIACEYYADILIKESKSEEAISYYRVATENKRPTAALKLGKLYEQKCEWEKAYEFYKIAAKAKVFGAEEAIKNCEPKCILHMGIKKQEKALIELKDELAMINGSEEEQAKILYIIEVLKKVCGENEV